MKLSITPWRAALSLALLLTTSAISLAWFVTPKIPANEALKTAMHQIDDSMKILGKGITAENRAASLDELAKIQSAMMTAKALTPDSAAKIDDKKRAAFVNDFRKTLIEAIDFTLTAETAIVDSKFKEADTVIRNKLGGMKATGHGKFKPDGGGGY